MSSPGSDPRDPTSILATFTHLFRHFANEQFPAIRNALWELPSKTLQRYVERDRSFDARQGPIGDPFRGFVDPGLADGIDERRRRYEEYLRKKRLDGEEREGREGRKGK